MQLPDRASDSGPELRDPGYTWRDYLEFAIEDIRDCGRRDIRLVNRAIEQLNRAKELMK